MTALIQQFAKVDTPDGLAQIISDCVANLYSLKRVSPDDIAILVATEAAIDKNAPGNHLGVSRNARCDEKSEDRIVVDSIRCFKGLERPVVVIAATPDAVIDTELPYVALL